VCEALYDDPGDPRGIEEWGAILGMSDERSPAASKRKWV
jgi:hypothetical protein